LQEGTAIVYELPPEEIRKEVEQRQKANGELGSRKSFNVISSGGERRRESSTSKRIAGGNDNHWHKRFVVAGTKDSALRNSKGIWDLLDQSKESI